VPPYDAVLFDDDGVLVDPPAPGTQRTAVRDAFRAVGVNEFGPVSVMRGGAHDRGVLVSWHFWRHEFYKPMGMLHDVDRGGFIFAPEVGVHEQVYEFDFSSLYPNIICTRNVSPDVIRCDCHSDREDIPGLSTQSATSAATS
jgi:DNA polymerase elongation subunit (family B)